MCLHVYKEDLPRNLLQFIFGIKPRIKPLIAQRDIVCYKVYRETDIPGVVESPYQRTKHLIGKPQPQVELGVIDRFGDGTVLKIYEGYHSYVDSDFVNVDDEFDGCVTKKCIIPKGSTYFIGNVHGFIRTGYVSTNLIIL